MATLGNLLIQFVGERPAPLFLVFLAVHVAAGLTCVISGAGAAISKKRPGWHSTFGRTYYWALLVVFLSSSVMSMLRWSRDYDLFILGAIAFSAASIGHSAQKVRWRGWPTYHITGMGSSYVVLLTAFYVDNGPHLPLWDRLPNIAFWFLPSLAGLPLIALALHRHWYLFAKARQPFDGDSTD